MCPLSLVLLWCPLFSAHCGDEVLDLNLGSAQDVIINANYRHSQVGIVIGQTDVTSHHNHKVQVINVCGGEAIQRELESDNFCFLASCRNGTKHSQTMWEKMEG